MSTANPKNLLDRRVFLSWLIKLAIRECNGELRKCAERRFPQLLQLEELRSHFAHLSSRPSTDGLSPSHSTQNRTFEEECTSAFLDKQYAKHRGESAHGRKKRPCPVEECPRLFASENGAKTRALMAHEKFEPEKTFITAWPRTSPNISVRNAREIIPAWDKFDRVSSTL